MPYVQLLLYEGIWLPPSFLKNKRMEIWKIKTNNKMMINIHCIWTIFITYDYTKGEVFY